MSLFNELSLWSEYPIVAFDTETSGPYPLESEIVELGAVKWYKGEIIGQFQTILKPSKPMTAENIAIVIFNLLRPHLNRDLDLYIRLYETPRNFVEYPVAENKI